MHHVSTTKNEQNTHTNHPHTTNHNDNNNHKTIQKTKKIHIKRNKTTQIERTHDSNICMNKRIRLHRVSTPKNEQNTHTHKNHPHTTNLRQ